jgi:hypothetical protein
VGGHLFVNPCSASRAQPWHDAVYRYRRGLHLSGERQPTKKELRQLINGIKSLTGFLAIEIDANGDFMIGRSLSILWRVSQGA